MSGAVQLTSEKLKRNDQSAIAFRFRVFISSSATTEVIVSTYVSSITIGAVTFICSFLQQVYSIIIFETTIILAI